MAIDTAEKRFSIMNFRTESTVSLPVPTGSFDQGDRQHLLDYYSGILFGALIVTASRLYIDVDTGDIFMTITPASHLIVKVT